MIGAGYVPIMTLYSPNLSGLGSRANLFATWGSAVLVASVLMMGAVAFAKNQEQIPYLFLVSTIPFVALGIVTQASVQYDTRAAWREQQTIWKQLFTVAPNFQDDTLVLLILPGYRDRVGYQNWKRTPLSAYWEVTSAVRLFYHNPTLSADILFPDLDGDNEPALTPQGVVNRDSGAVTPYTQCAAFIYDAGTGTLRPLDELPVAMMGRADRPVKLGTGRVLTEKLIDVPLRRLVE